MVNSVSANVQNAWAAREARNEDQSVQTPDSLFGSEATEETTNSVTNSTTSSNLSSEQIQDQIETAEKNLENIKKEKEETDEKIAQLQQQATELKEEIDNAIEEAIESANKYTEEQQEKIKNTVDSVMEEYLSGAITKEEMKAKLGTLLGEIDPELPAEITSVLDSIDSKINELQNITSTIAQLQTISECFGKQIENANQRLENLCAQKEEAEKREEEAKKCDPIGFVADGKICDFIIDRNGDGKFNNETEFLGAENNWNEMINLDKLGNNDGVVSAEEMQNAGVKVLVTDVDGTQSIVDVADLGVEEIDLSTYQSVNQQIGSGNEVLGVFGMTINGKQTNDTYNTLDSIDWLDKHYSNMFTDKAEGKGRFATENGLAEKQPGKMNIAPIFDLSDINALRERLQEANNIFVQDAKILDSSMEAAQETEAPVVDNAENEEEVEKEKEKELQAK